MKYKGEEVKGFISIRDISEREIKVNQVQ